MVSKRWFVVVAAVGALIVGVTAYNAGLAHGADQAALTAGAAATSAAPPATLPPYPYPYPYMYGWGWHRPWGFGFPFFLLIFFWFLLVKGLFWGAPWRRRYGYAGPDRFADGFDEWHRRAHERMKDDPTGPRSSVTNV